MQVIYSIRVLRWDGIVIHYICFIKMSAIFEFVFLET